MPALHHSRPRVHSWPLRHSRPASTLSPWKAHPRDPLAPASLTFDGRRIPGILHDRALPSSPPRFLPTRWHPPFRCSCHLSVVRPFASSTTVAQPPLCIHPPPRRDKWRRHPMVGNPLHHTTPRLGIAIVGFGIYLIGEAAYNRLNRPSGDHHH
ncbi:NADH dehydrogenase [ubiquinone] 1 beta subcomplex subunit 3-A [Zea mays]|uniref:NADH dehydrogenase [ubiquinone] 1 beta subcomplex subunit 3-A n=1 Tax=Zea mays TaxID=4577 RepID=A0A1D6LJT0_MAIZE|nr:NADH dehydrogenase [ubiquinone] 1 beta subcomplex subunit 3-A [Zea mays]